MSRHLPSACRDPSSWIVHCWAGLPLQVKSSTAVAFTEAPPVTSTHLPVRRWPTGPEGPAPVPPAGAVNHWARVLPHVAVCRAEPLAEVPVETFRHSPDAGLTR